MYILNSDRDSVFAQIPDALGESEMMRLNHLINSSPGKPVIHAHFCGRNTSPIIPSITILFYRDPSERIKSAFKEYSRHKQNHENKYWNDFWQAPFGRSITPWLSSNYLSHGGQRYIFNFDELNKNCGHLQALFLGLGMPCNKIFVYQGTVTSGVQNLEDNLDQALKDERFTKTFEMMVAKELNIWENLGLPKEWSSNTDKK